MNNIKNRMNDDDEKQIDLTEFVSQLKADANEFEKVFSEKGIEHVNKFMTTSHSFNEWLSCFGRYMSW